MHLTQQQQLNQMCPPPIGQSTAWFMNHSHHQTSTSLSVSPQTAYHNYSYQNNNSLHHQNAHHQQQADQNYYDINAGHSTISSSGSLQQNLSSSITTTAAANLAISPNVNVPQHNHLQHRNQQQQSNHNQHVQQQHHHQQQQHHQQHQQQQQHQQIHHHQQQPQQTNDYYSSYRQTNLQPSHFNQQRNQQHQTNQQQYSLVHHHQQPLTIQQPQPQHVHHSQQPSPISQTKPLLSPHTTTQPRPSPTLLSQHQQPSPNYQQHSPLLTSPSLQPSPVLHHQVQQHSPLNRQLQQTPPHHTPTPHTLHNNSRPASVKEVTSTTATIIQPSSILQTEVRILELNRRLQSRPINSARNPLPSHDQQDDLSWWEEVINDFFKEDATLTLLLHIDDKPVKYILRRALLPRFFRSYFDGGVTELSFNLKNSKESRGNNQSIILDCEQANILSKNILRHPKISLSARVVVCTEGQLSLEFVNNGVDPLMIKSWRLKIDSCREYIDRSLTAIGLPNAVLMEPITFQGLPSTTMFYLRMCSVMEPMQEIMSQHKVTNNNPRACLKKLLFEKYRYMSDDSNNKVPEVKRRRRKQPGSPASTKAPVAPKKSRTTPSTSAQINDSQANGISQTMTTNSLPPLSVVGEPSPMGEYRDENERLIKQIENSNHIPSKESTEDRLDTIVEPPVQSNEPVEEVVESKEEECVKGEPENVETLPSCEKEVDCEESSDKQEQTPDISEKEAELDSLNEAKPTVTEDEPVAQNDEASRPISEEPSEKENNGSVLNEDIQMNSMATQSENSFNIMSSIPEDKEDSNVKSTTCDLIVAKLPPSSNNKAISTPNGSSNKQNRRRSSERKETLREGLMRTSDFVVAMKDLKCEHPALWRITTGNNLLQQFEPKTQNGTILYENTNQYAGWNPEIKRDYIGVDVRLTQHTRNQITVERLLLNFQKLEDAEAFYDKHFAIYLQILISTALDSKFWEGIEGDPKHHDYFVTSRKIIDDTIKRYKLKLANKLKLSETTMRNIEKYPNLILKPLETEDKAQTCRNCTSNQSTQIVTFANKSYDLHSFKLVKVTNNSGKDDKDVQSNICNQCLEIVKLYSEVHHMSWNLYKLALKEIERHSIAGKPINDILDDCMRDEDWLAKVYAERDSLWSRVDKTQ